MLLPLKLLAQRGYPLRRGCWGISKYDGSKGIVREIEFLTVVRGSILLGCRQSRPAGFTGARHGFPAGMNRSYRGARSATLKDGVRA